MHEFLKKSHPTNLFLQISLGCTTRKHNIYINRDPACLSCAWLFYITKYLFLGRTCPECRALTTQAIYPPTIICRFQTYNSATKIANWFYIISSATYTIFLALRSNTYHPHTHHYTAVYSVNYILITTNQAKPGCKHYKTTESRDSP